MRSISGYSRNFEHFAPASASKITEKQRKQGFQSFAKIAGKDKLRALKDNLLDFSEALDSEMQ